MKELDPRYFTGHPVGNGLSARLWQEVIDEAFNSMYCPFVHAMAQGTLEKASFQAYVTQDAYYLEHYASAYKAAIRIAEDWEIAAAPTLIEELEKLVASVYEELEYLHKGYAETWGVNLSNTTPSPATLAYTTFLDYVSETAEDVAEIFAAMLPCARLYCWLGCLIVKDLPESTSFNNPYNQWFTNYSAPAYVVYPPLMESLFDSIAREERYDVFLRHYRRAMELEAAFFDTQPFAPVSRTLSVLAVDFDETITVEDSTTALLARCPQDNQCGKSTTESMSKHRRCDKDASLKGLFDSAGESDSPSSCISVAACEAEGNSSNPLESDCASLSASEPQSASPSSLAVKLSKEYSAGFSALLDSALTHRPGGNTSHLAEFSAVEADGEVTSAAPLVLPPPTDAVDCSATLGGVDPDAYPFDPEGLATFMDRLSDFDEVMNAKVEDSGILQGLTEEDAMEAAAAIQLRPFCDETIRLALSLGVSVHVISANWSDRMLRMALGMPSVQLGSKLAGVAGGGGEEVSMAAADLESGGGEGGEKGGKTSHQPTSAPSSVSPWIDVSTDNGIIGIHCNALELAPMSYTVAEHREIIDCRRRWRERRRSHVALTRSDDDEDDGENGGGADCSSPFYKHGEPKSFDEVRDLTSEPLLGSGGSQERNNHDHDHRNNNNNNNNNNKNNN